MVFYKEKYCELNNRNFLYGRVLVVLIKPHVLVLASNDIVHQLQLYIAAKASKNHNEETLSLNQRRSFHVGILYLPTLKAKLLFLRSYLFSFYFSKNFLPITIFNRKIRSKFQQLCMTKTTSL